MINMFRVLGPCLQAIIHSTWQAAILIAIVLLLQWSMRRHLPARWQAALWLIVLARLLTPVVPESSVSLFNLSNLLSRFHDDGGFPEGKVNRFLIPGDQAKSDNLIESDASRPPRLNPHVPATTAEEVSKASLSISLWWHVLCGIWMLGMLLVLIRVMVAIRGLRAIVQRCRDVKGTDITVLFARCQSEMGVSGKVKLLVSPDSISPAVAALGWRTGLLLPESVLTYLSLSELRLLFLHELAHVRRFDVLLQGLWNLVVAMHWFNPVIWLAMQRMQTDRELACDEAVLGVVGLDERSDYGRAILKVVETLCLRSHR